MNQSTTAAEWIRLLQDSGYRQTCARNTIVDIILETERALEPLEIFEIGRKRQKGLGLVTVYRTLERLEALGLVQRVHQQVGCNKYLRAARGHEHLLICTRCGRATFFDGDDISCLTDRVQKETGYIVTDHWFQLFGLCADCQKK